MEDLDDPLPWVVLSIFKNFTLDVALGLVLMLVLLIFSALISGAEVAFFSLSPQDQKDLEEEKSKTSDLVLSLLDRPKRLLATILIGNNLVNVGIIVLSTVLMDVVFDFSSNPMLGFVLQVVLVTFLILLMGEVIPKVYANKYSKTFSQIMAFPILVLSKIFMPLSKVLILSTSIIDKRITKKSDNISVDDLSTALELTMDENEQSKEENKILEGIVKFGNTDVKQVMTPRTDVVAIDIASNYEEVVKTVIESGFSRIPVYNESFDKIKGILYIKDLLPHIDRQAFYKWQRLVRSPFFVPENKKIDDLLKEFQEKKIHIAVVVDEYGGTSGIISMEDVIEEIVGEISDEFDNEDIDYEKIDENNYLFEGKIALNDLYRILEIDGEDFEESKGEADTLAGFAIEIAGKILRKNEKVQFNQYAFTIEAADKRRIKQIKVTINDQEKEEVEN